MSESKTYSMYFLAIVCPEELDKIILGFKLWMQEKYGCRVALRAPAHITLVPPFWYDNTEEQSLLDVLSAFTAPEGELDIQLSDFSHFKNRVIFIQVLETTGLNRIKEKAVQHFDKITTGITRPDDRKFHPHITIANRDLKPSDFRKAWEYFSRKKFDARFTANKISLLKLGLEKWEVIAEKKWY